MANSNSEKYIAKIAELYKVGDKDLEKMYGGAEQIDRALERFAWGDIEAAIDWFYVHKSDKSRPTLAAICAVLNTWVLEQKIARIPDEPEVRGYALPRTNIFSIAVTFDRLVEILVKCGLIPDGQNEIRATHSLVDKNGAPITNPMQVLRWRVFDAINARPDLFVKFPNASFLERLAIALDNQLVKIRVRDWGEYAAAKRTGVR